MECQTTVTQRKKTLIKSKLHILYGQRNWWIFIPKMKAIDILWLCAVQMIINLLYWDETKMIIECHELFSGTLCEMWDTKNSLQINYFPNFLLWMDERSKLFKQFLFVRWFIFCLRFLCWIAGKSWALIQKNTSMHRMLSTSCLGLLPDVVKPNGVIIKHICFMLSYTWEITSNYCTSVLFCSNISNKNRFNIFFYHKS